MSQENVEIVTAAFEAVRGNFAGILPMLAPDVVWEVRADLPDSDVYRGHDGMRRLMAAFAEAMEETWYEPEEILDAGDRVVVRLRWGGRGKVSGIDFEEHHETWVFALKAGKISHVKEFATRDQALKAAGLPE